MEITEIDITDIAPAGYNPRLISEEDYEYLKTSIEEFGLVDPIIINLNNNRIIGGHQRYDVLLEQYVEEGKHETLKMLKLNEIGWVFVDDDMKIKSENHEKALNIALNKISGGWDNPKLNALLSDIDKDTFDVGIIGFGEDEIDIIAFRAEEDSVDKYSSGNRKVESGTSALFRLGKYSIEIPFEEYSLWKDELLDECDLTGMSVDEVLLKRLDLSSIIANSRSITSEFDKMEELE